MDIRENKRQNRLNVGALLGAAPNCSAAYLALGTGWYPLRKGVPESTNDPVKALERYCQLNQALTPAQAANQLIELL